MTERNWERWEPASGYLVLALGLVAAAFERGAPPAGAPIEQTLGFLTAYRSELLAQSLLFVLSAGLYLWFFESLRTYLLRAEGGSGRFAHVAFSAGIVWAGIQMVMQSVQAALAMRSGNGMEPALAGMTSDMSYALSVIAYVPMAIMLAAVALSSLRARAFPAWLGWFSAGTGVVHLAMAFGLVADGGILVPGGALTYVLYALITIWLAAVTTVMVLRPR